MKFREMVDAVAKWDEARRYDFLERWGIESEALFDKASFMRLFEQFTNQKPGNP